MEKNDVIGLIGGTAILLGSFVIYVWSVRNYKKSIKKENYEKLMCQEKGQ